MNPRLAGFLTRLYPPAWRARYGAEYRMFLEVRRVSAVETLNVFWHAAVEHVREDWRYGLILIALLFSVEGGLSLAGGHAGEAIAQHPMLAVIWLAMEGGAIAVLLYALSLSIAIPVTLEIMPRRVAWILLLPAAAWAVVQYLPWRWTGGWWASASAVFAVIAGVVGIGFAGMCARIVLLRLQQLEPQDLDDLPPFMTYCWNKTGKCGPAKLEALRLSVMILGITLFAAQMRRADHLASASIIIGTSLLLYWDDVFRPRAAE
ncbi:MAG TPA: hypothetical protein VGK48_28910 [Terriglobia bacterium]|jgi:hypothetical protein